MYTIWSRKGQWRRERGLAGAPAPAKKYLFLVNI